MLEELTVKDFALLDSVTLEFDRGFSIFTGETGAGKSLLIGALSFLMGGRTDAASLREGADECSVNAVIDIRGVEAAQRWLEERGIEHDDGHIVVRRVYRASGRTSLQVQGQSISRPDLVSLMSCLIAIHGQHEGQSLLQPETQRMMVDTYAGIQPLVAECIRIWQALGAARAERRNFLAVEKEQQREAEFLRYQIAELKAAKLKSGEREELEVEERILASHEKLHAAIESAHAALSGSGEGDGAGSALRRAKSAAESASFVDPRLKDVATRLETSYYEVDDLATAIRSYRDSMNFDPARLEAIEARLSEIHRLEKKYSMPVMDLIQFVDQAQNRLDDLGNREERLDALDRAISALEQDYRKICSDLSSARKATADRLSPVIQAVLRPMGMQSADFRIAVRAKGEEGGGEDGPTGWDTVEYLIAPNPGSPPRPIARIASGGELSRVALAVKTVLAEIESPTTIIFDEIDTGIGGEAAVAVGRHLKELGHSRQVLCITHLASIASMAGSHFRVLKTSSEGSTTTEIIRLDLDERRAEIARMLAGDQHAETSLAHATELLRRFSAEDGGHRGI